MMPDELFRHSVLAGSVECDAVDLVGRTWIRLESEGREHPVRIRSVNPYNGETVSDVTIPRRDFDRWAWSGERVRVVDSDPLSVDVAGETVRAWCIDGVDLLDEFCRNAR
jgi:hypothetical protein